MCLYKYCLHLLSLVLMLLVRSCLSRMSHPQNTNVPTGICCNRGMFSSIFPVYSRCQLNQSIDLYYSHNQINFRLLYNIFPQDLSVYPDCQSGFTIQYCRSVIMIPDDHIRFFGNIIKLVVYDGFEPLSR